MSLEDIYTDMAQSDAKDGKDILYLTRLMCGECEESTKLAHEGPWVQLDQDPKWPDATHCPQCGEPYPDDLGVAVMEVQEAEVVPPTEERPDSNEQTASHRRGLGW